MYVFSNHTYCFTSAGRASLILANDDRRTRDVMVPSVAPSLASTMTPFGFFA